MKKISSFFYLLLFGSVACSPSTPSPNLLVDKIVHASIEAHGGLEKWKSIDKITYQKHTELFLEDGTSEVKNYERHQLHYLPVLSGKFISLDTTKNYTTTYTNGKGEKSQNGKTTDATKAFLSSYYVLNMPYKLLDPQAQLSYQGIDTLETGAIVDVIQAYYGSEDADLWWYYIDRKSHRLLANLVYHAPTYAYITNDEQYIFEDMLWNKTRTTYRTDSLRNIEYTRGEFSYEFEDISFKK